MWGEAPKLWVSSHLRGVPPIVFQLTPEGLPTAVGHLQPGGQQLPLLMLLPGGMKLGMPPPSDPAHCWDHPPVAGTVQPQQLMGLQPGAALCGQPPQPTGSCLLQAPNHPGPSTVLQGPLVQQQVLLVPGTLPTILEQEEEPFGDAMVHTEDQGQPAPISVCPHPTRASLTCSIAALESGAATTSSDIPEDITDIGDLLAWMNSEVAPKEVPDNIPGMDDDSAKCPAPPCTTSGHQQSTGSIQATKRKLPQSQDAPEQKHSR
ncbi:arginine-glutamic acid dipeptide repeats protein-like [Centrocercus urophasianus]|uniref:arginine-glutamic acid dipeptide repeats protein-like n=1 Tax=Centrocercus urophasianus TaxID=9002 RepID=UPI001C64DB83|nr:arginine-glutamic acid dipeptide repeats protein-like [Centrocercus urophasianus]